MHVLLDDHSVIFGIMWFFVTLRANSFHRGSAGSWSARNTHAIAKDTWNKKMQTNRLISTMCEISPVGPWPQLCEAN